MTGTSWREYLFPMAVAAAICAAGTLPYLYGYRLAGEDERFMGVVGRDVPGASGYLMFMRQAREGRFLLENQMTPEPLPRAYINLEWWFLGSLARWLGMSLETVFHLDRIATAFVCAWVLYYVVAVCLPGLFARRLAFSLIIFGSGVGWTVFLINRWTLLDLKVPFDIQGVCVLGYLVNKPHFIRGLICAALTCAFLIRGEQSGRRRYFVYSGLAAAVHAIFRPYHIPETYLMYLAFPALLCAIEGRFRTDRFANYLLAGLVFLPAAAYLLITAHSNVLGMEGWRRHSPYLLEHVLWLGLPFVVACICIVCQSIFRAIKKDDPAGVLMAAWLVVCWLIVESAPYIFFGHESSFGALIVAPPILFVLCLPALWEWTRNRIPNPLTADRAAQMPRRRVFAAVAFVLICALSNVIVCRQFFTILRNHELRWLYYLPNQVYQAIEWVDAHAPQPTVVLALPETAHFIPRLTRHKVVSAHDMLTARFEEKNAQLGRFFFEPEDEAFKQWFVRHYAIQYLIFGPKEASFGHFRPERIAWFHPVFQSGQTVVYRMALAP